MRILLAFSAALLVATGLYYVIVEPLIQQHRETNLRHERLMDDVRRFAARGRYEAGLRQEMRAAIKAERENAIRD